MTYPAAPSGFDFKGHAVRVVEINGEPWFVAKEVCEVLDLIGPASQHAKRLDPNERRVFEKSGISNHSLRVLFTGRANSITLINESGLYKLVLVSRKPEAQAFKTWVTGTVLPAILSPHQFTLHRLKGHPRDAACAALPLTPSDPECSAEKFESLSNKWHLRVPPVPPPHSPSEAAGVAFSLACMETAGKPEVPPGAASHAPCGVRYIHNVR